MSEGVDLKKLYAKEKVEAYAFLVNYAIDLTKKTEINSIDLFELNDQDKRVHKAILESFVEFLKITLSEVRNIIDESFTDDSIEG